MELHSESERVIMAFENKKKSYHRTWIDKVEAAAKKDLVKEKLKRRKAAIEVLRK